MGTKVPAGHNLSTAERDFRSHSLLPDPGYAVHVGNKASFSFELLWFQREGFYDIVAAEWSKETAGATSMERWQNKIRHLRQFLRGWAKNASGMYKKEKDRILALIDASDLKAELAPLCLVESAAKKEAKESLAKLMREEEIKLAQHAKVRHVWEGDNNTRHFNYIANGKHRKKGSSS